jgi:hypothetical protein
MTESGVNDEEVDDDDEDDDDGDCDGGGRAGQSVGRRAGEMVGKNNHSDLHIPGPDAPMFSLRKILYLFDEQ